MRSLFRRRNLRPLRVHSIRFDDRGSWHTEKYARSSAAEAIKNVKEGGKEEEAEVGGRKRRAKEMRRKEKLVLVGETSRWRCPGEGDEGRGGGYYLQQSVRRVTMALRVSS